LAAEDPPGTLLDLLSGLSEPVGGEGGVRVLDAMAARGIYFREIVVLGMNERVFPRFVLEDPFIRDAVRSRLEHRLGCRMPRKVEGYREERLLYSLLVGSADEVVLLHQRSDEKGGLKIPSHLLPKGKPRRASRHPAVRLAEAPFNLLTPREAALRTGQAEALGRARGLDVAPLVQAKAFLASVESRGAPTPYDGLIDARDYFQRIAERGFSPTALETLAECPFRYFAAKMLHLEELEEPGEDEGLTAMETGSLYHDVLERVHADTPLNRALEAAFKALEERRTFRFPILVDLQKEEIRAHLEAFLKANVGGEFVPKGVELELEADLPFAVGGRQTVTFRGYVDRLDVGKNGAFRAVDYKRARSARYGAKMETGVFKRGWLQPPLYFRLAEKHLGRVDRKRSRFVYHFIEAVLQGEKWELALEGDFWEREEEFNAMLLALLERIARGDFSIHPGDACRYCKFGTMCRKSHLPTRVRADEARRP
jgi:ATP-dependent helicase/nuclease subunit B